MRKVFNCPRNGDIFMQIMWAKVAYKNAIKANRMSDDTYFSNDLHELLLEKAMIGFWKTWNAKVIKPKFSSVIDCESDGHNVANRFEDLFRENCIANVCNNSQAAASDIDEHIATASSTDLRCWMWKL
jgi:hypothetical protein